VLRAIVLAVVFAGKCCSTKRDNMAQKGVCVGMRQAFITDGSAMAQISKEQMVRDW
jgi:hypothetical protein